jgi:hypothetical protein
LVATLLPLGGLLLAACGDRLDTKSTPTGEAPAPDEAPGTPSEPGPLAKELKAKADAGAARIPAEVKAVLQKAGRDLAASGILTQAKNTGAQAPAFSLKNAMGQTVRLDELRAQGPVVLTFYRGKW